ncbi:sulfurtransferase TusA family protein [Methanococcoides sp. SA1]|uniref:sulfurtransferase TusA family protein n=1 Tax=Methanococcoides sp. TaxID=1966350 RepID=UPI0015577863|nr:sulfurtransferase TusA family protein [Methanococcoides sp.]MCD4807154.1 sulfurtransferase TusA family protein [Methanococcoides sp.]NOQ48399.1 response regulator SirA [Methanococcoides sp.]NPE29390.1 sulfurtransferase TusA family protein [Methanococcoides sp. SA1]
MDKIIADFEIDVRGQCCPYPLIRTKQTMDDLESNEVLLVIANDAITPQNIATWTKKTGNVLLAVEEKEGIFNIYVRKA